MRTCGHCATTSKRIGVVFSAPPGHLRSQNQVSGSSSFSSVRSRVRFPPPQSESAVLSDRCEADPADAHLLVRFVVQRNATASTDWWRIPSRFIYLEVG